MNRNDRKIAIYYRVSTDKQDFDSQQYAINEYCHTNQYTNVTVYSDHGVSGKRADNRPQFQAMLADARASKIDTIIVYRLDRFSRDATTALRLILELDAAGVAFISVTQPVLNLGHENPFRRTMLAAFAEISEIERDTTVARIKSGLQAAKARGIKLGAETTITDAQRSQVIQLKGRGRPYRAIAKEVGISLGSVARIARPTG